jgi:ketosteroid isomerase-like protein
MTVHPPSSSANEGVVREYFAAMARGDVDGVLALMHEDVSFWIGGSIPISGTYDKAMFERDLRTGNPEFRPPPFTRPLVVTITGTTAQGDRVAVEAESASELQDGRRYRNLYHHLFVLRDGLIAEIREYMDTQLAGEVWCAPELRR